MVYASADAAVPAAVAVDPSATPPARTCATAISLPGTEIVARFEPQVPATLGTVVRPDGSVDRCEIISAKAVQKRVTPRPISPASTPSAPARAGRRPSVKFALAPPPAESDLTPLDEAAWRRLEDQLGFVRMEPAERSLAARLIGTRASGGGDRYWMMALGGVLALFVIELALTRAWSAAAAEGRAR
jgi:hypothetical protein